MTAKQRYYDKVYHKATTILCACGCKTEIKSKNKYGRDKSFVSGHNGRKYDDPSQFKREWNHRNRKKRYITKVERGHKLKQRIIKLMGGKCQSCSLEYNGKNGCVFQCHHRDPKQKLFGVNTRTLINYSWTKIKDEIAKCELLCANCHFIKENEEY